jgi:cytochrome c2
MAVLLDSSLSNSGSSNLKLPTQTLASLEVQASVEKFNLLHGHSSQAEFSDCSACHVQGGTLESKVSPHGLRGSKKSSSKKNSLENEEAKPKNRSKNSVQAGDELQPLKHGTDFYNPHILLKSHPSIPKCSNCHVVATPHQGKLNKPLGG